MRKVWVKCIPEWIFASRLAELIIEGTCKRAPMSPKEVIEEIAADARFSLTGNANFKKSIAFLWDDALRSEQHEFMIQGSRGLSG